MRSTMYRAALGLALVLGVVLTSLSAPSTAYAATKRIAGPDRYATAVAISQAAGPHDGTVFLASGSNFPDALAAGPVAAAERAALLLTHPNFVPEVVLGELRRTASEIVLVGSASTISEAVRVQLEREVPGAQITRIGGTDRVHTSLLLMDRLALATSIDHVWVVSGHKYPDALVAASVAGRSSGAILLDYHGPTAIAADEWATRIAPYVDGRVVRIAGSEATITALDESLLWSVGASSVSRHAGVDRYRTAIAIHDAFTPWSADGSMLLATGQNFPDALAGAGLAARTGAPLYLAPTYCNDAIASDLRRERDERGISTVIGLGSAASLSDLALNLQSCPAPPPPPPPPPPPAPPGPSPDLNVNCSDFPTRAAAQTWWDYWRARGYTNPGGLDGDRDGLVCESKRP